MGFRTIRGQKGTLYEIPILVVFLAILLSVFFGQANRYGFKKAAMVTGVLLGCILGVTGVIVLFLWALGWAQERLAKKPPKGPESPATGVGPK